ncbi:glycosyltransferase family 2 protein [Desertivirga brevis]|uniref:glycosyltransferase family 2 protein n=1 Tax=Desertivirga brevis TaxID=2810310 RepID=UPI001A95B750|nr:glycosyltransferase [Pedobacter sp. SYSU D00873]
MAINIDVVILSYAKNERLKALTDQTIETLITSENRDQIKFNPIVIESNKQLQPYQYRNATTIYPDAKFGFHKYLNIGIEAGSASYVCLANNDLIFKKGWASEILAVFNSNNKVESANPFCEYFHKNIKSRNRKFIIANERNIFKGILTGWCILVKRDVLDKIGLLDEQFDFWYADKDYGKTLLKHKIKHALVLNSLVLHLGNQSHDSIESDRKSDFTDGMKALYEKKWGKESVSTIDKIINKLSKVINGY